jgi:hypothetical protein
MRVADPTAGVYGTAKDGASFLNSYSTTSAAEDKAEVWAALMTCPSRLLGSQTLRLKADVLRLRANIADLYVNAPDTMTAGRTRTYTVSAGQMTLIAELFDSESGQVLARVVDTREARNTGTMQLSNSVVNASEARDIASAWARILHNGLDKARGIGKK